MNKSNQSTGIHCKVICNDQMRRFQFSGTEFSSLQQQVNQLLGLNCEFVLKYKDNEGDMITISSTEELACAIEISRKDNGGLFRLTVFLPETSATCPIPSVNVPFRPCHRGRGRGGKWGGPDSSEHPFKGRFEKHWSHHGGPDEHPCKGRFEKRWSHNGGPASSEHPCTKRFEKRREKLTFKRDLFLAYLSSLEQIKELSPEEERRKQIFQVKVQRLDSILAQFFPPKDQADYPSEKPDFCPQKEIPESEKPVSCPQKEIPVSCPQKEIPESEKPEFCPPKRMCHRKFEKKARKCEKKEHKEGKKKERKNSYLSEEAKAEIITLKSQIKEMKPTIWAIEEQLKTKKAALRVAYEAGHHAAIPELENEIWKIKQEKRAKKEQIKPLRQRVHQLKGGK